jgi:tRNA pseudouridine38-40 synthase
MQLGLLDMPEQAEGSKKNKRIALLLQYLGKHFHGWQYQPNLRTVQGEVELAIGSVLGYPVRLHGSGRTDTGVHASAQVAHFDTCSLIPAYRWVDILNHRLPDDVSVCASSEVDLSWHARFSAVHRTYRYTVFTGKRPNIFLRDLTWHYYNDPLDEVLIQEALNALTGHHHLSAFHRAGSSRTHSWVDLQVARCYRNDLFVYFEFQANAFLYGMIRLMVGLLVEVGRGHCSLEEFSEIWRMGRRDLVRYAAPPQGLCLVKVQYSDNPFSYEPCCAAQPYFSFMNYMD